MKKQYYLFIILLGLTFFSYSTALAQLTGADGKFTPTIGVGAGGGLSAIFNSYDNDPSFSAGLKLKYFFNPEFNLTLYGNYDNVPKSNASFPQGKLTVSSSFDINLGLAFQWNLAPKSTFNPYLLAGGGVILARVSKPELSFNNVKLADQDAFLDGTAMGSLVGGAGIEWFVGEHTSLDLGATYNYVFADRLHTTPPIESVILTNNNPASARPVKYYDNPAGLLNAHLGINFYVGELPPPPPALPPSVSFTVSPTPIQLGKETFLSWSVKGADTILIDNVPVDTNGTRAVKPTKNAIYTLTAIGRGGTVTKTATVQVTEPPPPPPVVVVPVEVPKTFKTIGIGEKLAYQIKFKSGSAVIDKSENSTLDQIARELNDRPELYFEISGHTDNVGKPTKNIALSLKRANSMRLALIKRKVLPRRISIKGMGPNMPVTTNETEEGRATNRRIEFKVTEILK